MSNIERKMLAHYIDSALPSAITEAYERLGKDLEEHNVSMNPNVTKKNNILGEVSTKIGSYQPSAEVAPLYAEKGTGLFTRLQSIVDGRLVLDDLKTTIVEVHTWDPEESQGTPTGQYVAYREDAIIEVQSYGGDTTGYQIPFTYHLCGNRVKGLFNPSTKVFTADS